MKKHLALMLSLLMLLTFVSCNSDIDSGDEGTTVDETTAAEIIADEQTDKEEVTEEVTEETTGEVSEETTEEATEETTEETTEEDTGDEAFEELDMTPETIPSNNSDGYSILRMHDQYSSVAQNHMTLLPAKQIGIHFVVDKGILEAVVLEGVPSWGNDVGGFTVKIFAWNTDYNTTVAADPIEEQVLDGIPDMGEAVFTLENKVGEGEYLFLICDAFDESGSGIGICNQTSNVNDDRFIEGYINGKANAKVGPTGYFVIYQPEQE